MPQKEHYDQRKEACTHMMGKVNNKCYCADGASQTQTQQHIHTTPYFCLETYDLVVWVLFLNSSTTAHNLKDIGKKHTMVTAVKGTH